MSTLSRTQFKALRSAVQKPRRCIRGTELARTVRALATRGLVTVADVDSEPIAIQFELTQAGRALVCPACLRPAIAGHSGHCVECWNDKALSS